MINEDFFGYTTKHNVKVVWNRLDRSVCTVHESKVACSFQSLSVEVAVSTLSSAEPSRPAAQCERHDNTATSPAYITSCRPPHKSLSARVITRAQDGRWLPHSTVRDALQGISARPDTNDYSHEPPTLTRRTTQVAARINLGHDSLSNSCT